MDRDGSIHQISYTYVQFQMKTTSLQMWGALAKWGGTEQSALVRNIQKPNAGDIFQIVDFCKLWYVTIHILENCYEKME